MTASVDGGATLAQYASFFKSYETVLGHMRVYHQWNL